MTVVSYGAVGRFQLVVFTCEMCWWGQGYDADLSQLHKWSRIICGIIQSKRSDASGPVTHSNIVFQLFCHAQACLRLRVSECGVDDRMAVAFRSSALLTKAVSSQKVTAKKKKNPKKHGNTVCFLPKWSESIFISTTRLQWVTTESDRCGNNEVWTLTRPRS